MTTMFDRTEARLGLLLDLLKTSQGLTGTIPEGRGAIVARAEILVGLRRARTVEQARLHLGTLLVQRTLTSDPASIVLADYSRTILAYSALLLDDRAHPLPTLCTFWGCACGQSRPARIIGATCEHAFGSLGACHRYPDGARSAEMAECPECGVSCIVYLAEDCDGANYGTEPDHEDAGARDFVDDDFPRIDRDGDVS